MGLALIPCGVCGASIAPDAPRCPKCGTEDPWRAKAKQKWVARIVALVMVIGGLGYFWFFYLPNVKERGVFNNTSQDK